MLLYGSPNKNKIFFVISLIICLCFLSFACFSVFWAVVTVVSTVKCSNALSLPAFAAWHSFPMGEINEIKINKKFKYNFCFGLLSAGLTCF